MDYGLNRTERIEVRVSPEELAILERMADRKKVSVSDYLRWMAMWAAFKAGDKGALKHAWDSLKDEQRERMRRGFLAVGAAGCGRGKVREVGGGGYGGGRYVA